MKRKKESPPSGGLVSDGLAASSNNGNVAKIRDGILCISCGVFFQRERHSDQFCNNCEREGGLE